MTGNTRQIPGLTALQSLITSVITPLLLLISRLSSTLRKFRPSCPRDDLVHGTGDFRHQKLKIMHIWAIAP